MRERPARIRSQVTWREPTGQLRRQSPSCRRRGRAAGPAAQARRTRSPLAKARASSPRCGGAEVVRWSRPCCPSGSCSSRLNSWSLAKSYSLQRGAGQAKRRQQRAGPAVPGEQSESVHSGLTAAPRTARRAGSCWAPCAAHPARALPLAHSRELKALCSLLATPLQSPSCTRAGATAPCRTQTPEAGARWRRSCQAGRGAYDFLRQAEW